VRLAAATAIVLALAAGGAAAAPPGAGVLVPGRSLGDLRLGWSKAQVEGRWGRAYGVCRGCAAETWYFNYFAYQPRGAGVEFRDGRVAAVFTLFEPLGWQTTRGLALGDSSTRVTALYGTLPRRECAGYAVLELRRADAVTAFYIRDDRVWAFALSRPAVERCR
jgi:hypothetical protein